LSNIPKHLQYRKIYWNNSLGFIVKLLGYTLDQSLRSTFLEEQWNVISIFCKTPDRRLHKIVTVSVMVQIRRNIIPITIELTLSKPHKRISSRQIPFMTSDQTWYKQWLIKKISVGVLRTRVFRWDTLLYQIKPWTFRLVKLIYRS